MASYNIQRQAMRQFGRALSVRGRYIARHPVTAQIGQATRRASMMVADFLVPPVCMSCRRQLTSHHTLCPQCWVGVDFICAPICDRLGTPLPFATGDVTVSAAALAAPPAYDRARAVALHTDIMRGLIHSLKYGDRTDGVAVFGRWLHSAAQDFIDETNIIIPIPLNRWRLWSRRFNQAALLSRARERDTDRRAGTHAAPPHTQSGRIDGQSTPHKCFGRLSGA